MANLLPPILVFPRVLCLFCFAFGARNGKLLMLLFLLDALSNLSYGVFVYNSDQVKEQRTREKERKLK